MVRGLAAGRPPILPRLVPSIASVRGFLREMAPKGSVCAEIGVWQGDFSARILDLVKPSKLHLVDPWQFVAAEPYRQARYGGLRAHGQADMDRLYTRFFGALLRRSHGAASRFTGPLRRLPPLSFRTATSTGSTSMAITSTSLSGGISSSTSLK